MSTWGGLLQALPWIAGGAALVALAGAGLASVLRLFALRSERDTLMKADTAAAIASADLATLGFHLFERLGSTSVRNYLGDDEVQADINGAFVAVRKYLGGPSLDRSAESAASESEYSKSSTKGDSGILGPASSEDTWTLLARSRRDLESALSTALGIDADQNRTGVGQLLALAHEMGLISNDQARELREAVNVANRGVHGLEVTPEAALNSLTSIAHFLQTAMTRPAFKRETSKPLQKSRDYHVVPGKDGGWEVRAIGAGRASAKSSTKREAINRARDIVHTSGGGEVTIHSNDGRIQARDTVAGKIKLEREK